MKKILNLFKGFWAYNYGLTKNFNHPVVLNIETTNVCNLKCPICPARVMKRKKGFMEDEVFKKVVEEAKKYTRFVSPFWMGEPLTDKKIYERIKYCKANGLDVGISTNATLLDESASRNILESGLDKILLSCDGATKETYEKVRNGGDFHKTKENIHRFLKMKKAGEYKKPWVIIQIIRMNETEKEIKQFKEEWKGLVDEIKIKDFCTWANQVDGIKELSRKEHRYYKKEIKKRSPCYYLWHSFMICWDGSVAICCRDFDGKYVLGNIMKDSLEDIWNGERMVALRKAQIKGDFSHPLCKNCDDYPVVAPSKFIFTKNNLKKAFRHLVRKSGI